jgi:hypothetical protein
MGYPPDQREGPSEAVKRRANARPARSGNLTFATFLSPRSANSSLDSSRPPQPTTIPPTGNPKIPHHPHPILQVTLEPLLTKLIPGALIGEP